MSNDGYKVFDDKVKLADDEELARRILREVVQQEQSDSTETDDDEYYASERVNDDQNEDRSEGENSEPKKESSSNKLIESILMMLTGNILLKRGVSKYYSHMFIVAVLFFISIMVLFGSLHLDMTHNRLTNESQMLREKSIRLKEVRSSQTTHSAIIKELKRRKLPIAESDKPAILVD